MKFETYSDMSTEIERRTCVLDAAIANMLCLYNAASFFMIMINILIFIIISGFVFLTHVFDGYKLIVYALYVSVVMWEYLASSIIRIRLDKQILQMKCDLAWNVFVHYEHFDEFDPDDGANYFEKNLLKHAGIYPKDD